ncbi:MAG: hypothetical protein MUP57_00795 [Clostridia bacterium]|nr:hypothetical protein [Clostridia bacterium]
MKEVYTVMVNSASLFSMGLTLLIVFELRLWSAHSSLGYRPPAPQAILIAS